MPERLSEFDPRPTRFAAVESSEILGGRGNALLTFTIAERWPAGEIAHLLGGAETQARDDIAAAIQEVRAAHSTAPEYLRLSKLATSLAQARAEAVQASAGLRNSEAVYDSVLRTGDPGDAEFAAVASARQAVERTGRRVKVLEGELTAAQDASDRVLNHAITERIATLTEETEARRAELAERLLAVAADHRNEVATTAATLKLLREPGRSWS